jgi:hypothetical protein
MAMVLCCFYSPLHVDARKTNVPAAYMATLLTDYEPLIYKILNQEKATEYLAEAASLSPQHLKASLFKLFGSLVEV